MPDRAGGEGEEAETLAADVDGAAPVDDTEEAEAEAYG